MRLFHRQPDRPLNCRQVGKVLQRYLDGDVDELIARRLMRHLEECRRCGMEAAAYTEIKASLARRGGDASAEAIERLREFGEQLLHEGPPEAAEVPDEPTGA